MKSLNQYIIYTQDTALAQRVDGVLRLNCVIKHIDDPQQLKSTLSYNTYTILLFDLRANNTRQLLPWVLQEVKHSLVIALTDKDSVPAREAQTMGAYAVESLEINRASFNDLITRAQSYLQLIKENNLLKERNLEKNIGIPNSEVSPTESSTKILAQFFGVFRNLDNINTMLKGMVEGISSCAKISRVGIFAITSAQNNYQLMAGNKCLEDSYKIKVSTTDAIVHWMNINAHIISRTGLPHLQDTSERLLLQHWLELLGAEAIIPLYGRKQIIGWIFVGRKSTGESLEQSDLETLSMLGDYASTMLENSLLYDELSAHNALTNAVFNSVPAGIVTVDSTGIINWINRVAEDIFKVPAVSAKGRPVEKISTKLADQLNRCIKELPVDSVTEWIDTDTNRYLSVIVRKLISGNNNECTGAVALVNDFTRERTLEANEKRVARAAFWTDLAAAISHEVRNPLVAISTFAQLLPESYDDPEFRNDFSNLVSKEISKLNAMVNQINEFANYPEAEFKPVAIKSIITKAVETLKTPLLEHNIPIEINDENVTSNVNGDKDALTEVFVHLIKNSIEALAETKKPVIKITITEISESVRKPVIVIRIKDNGPGISEEVAKKIFSPFFSTKNRGIGLGLPIVKRTLEDHSGSISINTNTNGGDITVSLPI